MSFLIDLAVHPLPDGTYKWGTLPAFNSMHWILGKPKSIRDYNTQVLKHFSNPGCPITTLEKLKKAPVDAIIIVHSKDKWEILKSRNPVPNPEFKSLEEFL
jgi:hypothetical protein